MRTKVAVATVLAGVAVAVPEAAPEAAPRRRRGALSQGSGRIVIRLEGAPRRFKYAGCSALHSPERLAIDPYESRPPSAARTARWTA